MSNRPAGADELTLPVKRTDGETLEDRLTANAYHNILPARYLRKDPEGNPREEQEELFPRVAKNVALAEAVFEADNRGVEITVTPDQLKPDHPRRDELAEEVFGKGVTADSEAETTLSVYNVNKFAYDTIVPELPDEVREQVETKREEFESLMDSLSFMPNSPTLMNAGDELQQLSACFVDSPEDDIDDIHQTAKEAAQVFQCLTEDATVAVEEKGVVSIADVEPGDQIVQRDDDGHRARTVDEVHAYDDAPTKRLVTEGGVSVRGTPNHRLLVDGEWREIDDVEHGETVSLRLGWLTDEDETPPLEPVAAGGQWENARTVSNEAIAELHADGHSDYEIAAALDCSPSTVQRRRANELDLPANGTGGRPAGASFDEDAFDTLYDEGHSDGEMAAALDVSPATIQQHRTARGLEANGQPVKTVTQPEELTADLAELLGIWIGDGSVHQDGIRFHVNRDDVLNHIDTLSRELFDTGIDYTWSDGCYEAVIHSHEVKRFWLRNFGDAKPSSASASVPDPIRRTDHERVCAFLRGLFSTDGTLTKGRYPRLYSASEELVEGTLQLLLGVGIPATKWEWENDDREYFSVAPTDSVGLERFASAVGYVDTRSTELSASLSETPPGPTQCGTVVDGHTWEQEIVAVEDADPETVYDVTVAGNHEYVANGVVSHNSGGGMGYAFWRLRPYGDPVGSTGGIASGPITFMRTYDQLCETIAQGGARRGAQMGVMRVSHPDVIQFLHAKNKDVSLAHTLRLNDPDDFTHNSFADALEEARELIDEEGRVPKHLRNAVEGHLSNFNISVGITDEFMDAVFEGEEFTFTNPRTGEPHIATAETKELYDMFDLGEHVEVGEELSVPAETLWDQIVDGAHENGEPGVIYLERVNKQHSFDVEEHPEHRILATNPCGEQPLEEYEACNLGHINLSTLVDLEAPDWRVWYDAHGDDYDSFEDAVDAFLAEAIDFDEFDYRIDRGTQFLENVVTMSDFPVPRIEETVRDMRKIGLGVMGLAQLYIQLGIQYGTEAGNEVARQLMTHINHESKWTSHRLAEERGTFADFEESKYADPTEYREWFEHHTGLDADEWADGFPIRNHNTTTVAPTGCVDEGSLVSTDEGLRPIKDLDETTAEFEQWDEIDVGVSTDGGTKSATAVYDNGFADVRRIETEGGFNVSATPNHRFRTITDDGEYAWREAGEFEPGDTILLQRGTFDGETGAPLDTSEAEQFHHNTDDNLVLPESMSPELAEFLGYFMGDGYVHKEVGVKLVVDSTATELDDHLRELGESIFGVSPTVEDKDTRHILTFGGRHLSRYFLDNGWEKDAGNEGEGAASAFVPESVLRGDESIATAFLRGLFEADGTASRKVELSTVSERLADQVQTLLLSLGIVFVRDTLEMESRADHYGDRPRHSLRGANKREDRRFLDEVGFVTKTTEIDLTSQSHRNDTYPPAVVETLRDVEGYESVSSDVKSRVSQSLINGSVSRKLVRDVEDATGESVCLDGRRLTDFYAATVGSVSGEKAYTKDISVPSNNTYVANGFVTHNTTSMIGNTTGGIEPIYNVAFYKNVSGDVQGDEMLVEFDDYFLRVLEDNDIDVEAVKQEAQDQMAENEFDGVSSLSTVPAAISELFVVTGDLSGKQHAAVQCATQEGVDSAISKTCNFPNSATKEDMDEVYRYIYENGGKGVTVYRDGTRSKQVLTTRAQNTDFADESEAAETLVEQIEEVFGGIEGFLDNEDVQAALDREVERLLSAADGETDLGKKRPRPDVLYGVTQRIDTGYGKLYVNINEDGDGRPFELFANIGNSGGFTASFTEALAKTISTALRSGVDPSEIASELQGIRSPKVAWDKGEQINSIPDAIGTAMRRYLDGEIEKGYPQQQNLTEVSEATEEDSVPQLGRETDGGASVDVSDADVGSVDADGPDAGTRAAGSDAAEDLLEAGESPECPECGSMSLYYSEGCKTCESCGWSEC